MAGDVTILLCMVHPSPHAFPEQVGKWYGFYYPETSVIPLYLTVTGELTRDHDMTAYLPKMECIRNLARKKGYTTTIGPATLRTLTGTA